MENSFAAVTSLFNPCGYDGRRRCYDRFRARLEAQGVELWTIEAALPGASFWCPRSERVLHVYLPEAGRLWQKERLINLLVAQLPDRIKKIAWLDCDVLLENAQWASEASRHLERKPVVQLFDFASWLGPDGEPLPLAKIGTRRPGAAFLNIHANHLSRDFSFASPGFGWAATRAFFASHGLYENCVVGGGDSIITAAFFGWHDHAMLRLGGQPFCEDASAYVKSVFSDVKGEVGFVRSGLSHLWHGSLSNRAYLKRHLAMARMGFDPSKHLQPRQAGRLIEWSAEAPREMQRYVSEYFHRRREDGPAR